MLELVAERGCGYVLMHIEGPPRTDRDRRAYDDPVEHLLGWFARADRDARSSSGSTPEQIALDPGLDFDLDTDDDLELLRRLGELRALGRPLFVALSRKDFLGAVLAGSWEDRLRGRAARGGDPGGDRARGRRGRRDPAAARRHRARRAAHRGRDREPRAVTTLGDAPSLAWERLLEAGEIDERLVTTSVEDAAAPRAPWPRPRRSPPSLPRRSRAPGSPSSTRTRSRRSRRPAAGDVIVTSGTASGKSLSFNLPVLDAIARDPKTRALYLYPTKALAQDQARKLSELGLAELRHAIYDGDTPRDDRPRSGERSNLVLTNPDMLNMGLLSHHKGWGDFLANLEWVVVDEAHTYRGVFGSHVANVLRRLRRVARVYGSEPRFISPRRRSPTRSSSPSELTGTEFALVDSDGAPRAKRRIAIWNPPVDRREDDEPPLGALRGRRAALRSGRQRLADDLLPAQPPRDRADPALRADAARGARRAAARRADRALPRRLHAAAAARDRGQAGRPASCSRWSPPTRSSSGSTSASSTRRSASPSPARSPACARCGGAPGAAARGSRSTSPARTRSTSSSAATRTSSSPARSRRRSSTTTNERIQTAHVLAAAYEAPLGGSGDQPGAADDAILGAALARARRRARRRRAAAPRPRRPLPAARSRLSRRRDLAALGLARLGRGRRARLGRAARPGRGRARLLDRPPRRDLPPSRALLRGRRARRRLAPRDRRRLRRRLVHAAEEGDRRSSSRRSASSGRSARAAPDRSSSTSARSRSPSR